MSIKMNVEIPEVFDVEDKEMLRQFCVAVKMFCDELARKAQSQQMEVRSSVPGTNDLEEGEFVRYVNGATIRIYTKQNGNIQYWNLS